MEQVAPEQLALEETVPSAAPESIDTESIAPGMAARGGLRVWCATGWRLLRAQCHRDNAAWLLSLAMHAAILASMTTIIATRELPNTVVAVTAELAEPPDPLTISEEFTYADVATEEIGSSAAGDGAAAIALAPVMALEPTAGVLGVEETQPVVQVDDLTPMREEIRLATGPKFTENVPVMGSAGVGAVGTGGAIDRLTQEILLSLEERPTLVVWLFDQSGSLDRQRAEIVQRFGKIYDELGVIEASGQDAFAKHEDKPLLTSIVAYGENVTFLTPRPTDNIEEIKSAVESIAPDESGIERTFEAVAQVIDRYRPLRTREPRRNVKIVLFTDEVGDDEAELDRTVTLARRLAIPVYCVGVPAPFGRLNSSVKYIDPDPQYDQTPQWIKIRQGPESRMPELVQIGDETEAALDSGFGPYALTRLAYETGGIFFAVHPNRNSGQYVSGEQTAELAARMSHFFDADRMNSYRPDYVSMKEYERMLRENGARQALVKAASASWITSLERPLTFFPKRNDAELAQLFNRAQQSAAVIEPKLNQLYEILLTGLKDRPKLSVPRWQAGYDLSLGMVLAHKVRTEGYNLILAKAKQGMQFSDPMNDTWILERSGEITGGSVLEKHAAEARQMLARVVEEHPGTPWAMLAQRELDQPLGWKWAERHTGVNEPRSVPPSRPRLPSRPPPKL